MAADSIQESLKQRGFRLTRQRRILLDLIDESGRHLDVERLYELALQRDPKLNRVTVYRTIKRLLDDGTIVQVELPGEAPRYEVAGKGHHHHFRCSGCKKVYDLQGCPGAFKQILPKGFSLEGHEVYLFGRCTECAAA